MQDSPWMAFAIGFLGSIAVEVALYLQVIGPRGGIPAKYKTRHFIIARFLLALASGGLATLYYPQASLLVYLHVGAASPAIFTKLNDVPKESIAETSE